MPEGPEVRVETFRIRDYIKGWDIQTIEFLNKRWQTSPPEGYPKFIEYINNKSRKVTEVDSHGKKTWIEIDDWNILTSYGLSGTYIFDTEIDDYESKYFTVKLIFTLDDKTREIYFHDIRGFGNIKFYIKIMLQDKLSKLGVDPLKILITKEYIFNLLKKSGNKKKDITSFLMDQNNIAGIGNMYKSEILYLLKVHPDAIVVDLPEETIEKIPEIINDVMRTMFSKTWKQEDRNLKVYGRKVDPDGNGVVTLLTSDNRNTYFSPTVQTIGMSEDLDNYDIDSDDNDNNDDNDDNTEDTKYKEEHKNE